MASPSRPALHPALAEAAPERLAQLALFGTLRLIRTTYQGKRVADVHVRLSPGEREYLAAIAEGRRPEAP